MAGGGDAGGVEGAAEPVVAVPCGSVGDGGGVGGVRVAVVGASRPMGGVNLSVYVSATLWVPGVRPASCTLRLRSHPASTSTPVLEI